LKLADFGFTSGINEVIAITFDQMGKINTAPIGIIVEDENSHLAKIRLYPSHTRKNIENGSDVWINITYDPIIFTKTAFEDLNDEWFESLEPPIIKGAVAWCRFKVKSIKDFIEIELTDGKILRSYIRPVNRGFNALIEALVYATRYVVNRDKELLNKIIECKTLIDKCGSSKEKEAFNMILKYINI